MTHTAANPSLRRTAKLAGLLYFTAAMTAPFSLLYVPAKTMVAGDAAATAQNILDNEFLFRSAIVANFIGIILSIFVLLYLYRLFQQVDEHQAKLMAAFVLVQIPVSFLLMTFSITSLMMLKGGILKSFEPAQRQDMAMLFLKIRDYGTLMLEIFWGLWLFPFGQLVYKSGFIPRILGVLLFANGIAYISIATAFLLFPDYRQFVERYTFPLLFGELAIILWLLLIGVKAQKKMAEVY